MNFLLSLMARLGPVLLETMNGLKVFGRVFAPVAARLRSVAGTISGARVAIASGIDELIKGLALTSESLTAEGLFSRIERFNAIAEALTHVSGVLNGVKAAAANVRDKLLGSLKEVSNPVLNAAAKAGQFILTTARSQEDLMVKLETVTGSSKKARQEFEWMSRLAERSPFAVTELANAFIDLKNQGLDPSHKAIKAYGNIAASLGKPISEVVSAVSSATDGKFDGLTAFGIKAEKAGSSIKMSYRGMTTLIKNDSASIQNYLQRLGETDFASGMNRGGETLNGLIARLQHRMETLAGVVDQSGLGAALRRGASELLRATDGGEALAQVLGKRLGDAVNNVVDGFIWLRDIGEQVQEKLGGAQETVDLLITTLALFGTISYGPIVPLLLLLEDVIVWMNGGDSLFGGLYDGIVRAMQGVGQFVTAIVGGFTWLSNTTKAIFDGINMVITGWNDAMYELGYMTSDVIIPGIIFSLQAFGAAFMQLIGLMLNGLGQLLASAGTWLQQQFDNVVNGILGKIDELVKNIQGRIPSSLLQALGGLGPLAEGAMNLLVGPAAVGAFATPLGAFTPGSALAQQQAALPGPITANTQNSVVVNVTGQNAADPKVIGSEVSKAMNPWAQLHSNNMFGVVH